MELSVAGVGNASVDFDDYCSRLFIYLSIPSIFVYDPLLVQHLRTHLRVLEDISSSFLTISWFSKMYLITISYFWHDISDHDFVL